MIGMTRVDSSTCSLEESSTSMNQHSLQHSPLPNQQVPNLELSSGSETIESSVDVDVDVSNDSNHSITEAHRRESAELFEASFSFRELPLTPGEVLEASLSFRRREVNIGEANLYPSVETIEAATLHGTTDFFETTAYHPANQSTISQIVAVESVMEEEQAPSAFVLVDTVLDEPCSEDVILDAVLSNEATTASANVVECEWTDEDLDEKMAAAMGLTAEVGMDNEVEEQADVVGIAEHDVHPSDFSPGDVRATFVGRDYFQAASSSLFLPPPPQEEQVTFAELPDASQDPVDSATVVAITEEEVHPADVEAGEAKATFTHTLSSAHACTFSTTQQDRPANMFELTDAPHNDVGSTPVMAITEEEVHSAYVDPEDAEATLTHTFPSTQVTQPAIPNLRLSSSGSVEVQANTVIALSENNVPNASVVETDIQHAPATYMLPHSPVGAITHSNALPSSPSVAAINYQHIVEEEETATALVITEELPTHPSEIVENAATATLVGRDYSNTVSSSFPDHYVNDALSTPQLSFAPTILPPPPVFEEYSIFPCNSGQEASVDVPSAELFPSSAANLLGPPSASFRILPPSAPPGPQQPTRNVSNASAVSNTASERDSPSTRSLSSRLSERISLVAKRNTKDVMEKLFGDSKCRITPGIDIKSGTGSILPRTALSSMVFLNHSTNMWIAAVNTNQKALDNNDTVEASRALKSYSVRTQLEADAIARQKSPPRMFPFSHNPMCFVCSGKFAVFRRACHCRNCGVCVCASCTISWSSKMIPETYNIKNNCTVNICISCDWLCTAFRTALLNGEHDEAVALYSTGNINLTTPFANVKGELFFPLHCAVLGGRLSIVRWLVDEQYCPFQYTRNTGCRSMNIGGQKLLPLLTSKGRSLLGIAMAEQNVDIVRYFVIEKGFTLFDEQKGLSMATALHLLNKSLRKIPPSNSEEIVVNTSPERIERSPRGSEASSGCEVPAVTTNERRGHIEDLSQISNPYGNDIIDDHSDTSVVDACILCYENSIDCVITPCGHQICCMQCSSNLSICPVCASPCSIIRVYKP